MLRKLPCLRLFALAGCAALSTGCLIPHGSNARPVQPLPEGTALIGANVVVPFAIAGNIDLAGDSFSGSGVLDDFNITPGGSFDMALTKAGTTLGLDLSYASLLSVQDGADSSRVGFLFVNPRVEIPLQDEKRSLSLTIDASVAVLLASASSGGDSGSGSVFFPMPAFGLRYYLPIGDGGLIISQSIGTAFINFYMPGSVAYDIAIGDLHIMPEFKWDPTLIAVSSDESSASVFTSWFSGGLAVMYAL